MRRYNIMKSCLEELMEKGLIEPREPLSVFGMPVEEQSRRVGRDREGTNDRRLHYLALIAEGMSGRALRKLPLRAHAVFVQRAKVKLAEFLRAIHRTIGAEAVVDGAAREESKNDASMC